MPSKKVQAIQCAHCKRTFHITFKSSDSGEQGDGEVAVTCLYCEKNVIVKVPRDLIPKDTALKSSPK